MKQYTKIKTADGILLSGLFEKSEQASNKCIILCHGLGVDKEEKGTFTKLPTRLANEGFHTFRFDFRGCGDSDGVNTDFTLSNALKDLKSVIIFLKTLQYNSFIVLAASFSGGCSSIYASENPEELKGLILWNALIDYEEKINPTTDRNKKNWGQAALDSVKKYGYIERKSGFRLGKKLIEEVFSIEPWRYLIKYRGPLIFIHGTSDSFVPSSYSVKYSEQIVDSKLVLIEGAEHGFHNNDNYYDQAEDAALGFIKEIFK